MLAALLAGAGATAMADEFDPSSAEGRHRFSVAPDDIRLEEPRDNEIVVVVNHNAGPGNHAGIFAGARVSDPAGSYQWVRSHLPDWSNPSLADYVKFQMEEDGKKVRVYRFDVSPGDFAAVLSRLPEADAARPLFCAAAVQNAIAGIGPFRTIEPIYWTSPAALAGRLDSLTRGADAAGACRWADGSRC